MADRMYGFGGFEVRDGTAITPVSTLTYDGPSDGPRAVSKAGTLTYSYDGAGRLTKRGNATFEWDHKGRLVSAKERPDVAIEVNWTSGGVDKLEIYRRLRVEEVWMWEDGGIAVFLLDGPGYVRAERSRLLPDLDLALIAELSTHPVPATGGPRAQAPSPRRLRKLELVQVDGPATPSLPAPSGADALLRHLPAELLRGALVRVEDGAACAAATRDVFSIRHDSAVDRQVFP